MTVSERPDGAMASTMDREVSDRGGGDGEIQIEAVLNTGETAEHAHGENQITNCDVAVDTIDIPSIRVEVPAPRRPTLAPSEVKQEDDEEEEGDEDDDDDNDGGVEEMVEEDEEEKEMTQEEKREMYLAVQSGEIDALEDCLDKPNSDITMIWFRENLLMTSIREGHQEMAEFLLDNGVDHTYSSTVMGMRDTASGKIMERFELSCRQMAYDKNMVDIVEIIDLLQDNLFPFYKPAPRTPRFRRPKPATSPESERSPNGTRKGSEADENSRGSQSDTDGSDSDTQGGLSGVTRKKSRDNKRRKSAKFSDECEDNEDRDRTGMFSEGFEVDSGHHSLGSRKLKIGLVRQHDRLSEREEKVNSNESVASPKRVNTDGDQSVDQSAKEHEEEATEVNDEGYGSISLKSTTPCISPEMKPLWMATEHPNQIRSTKSALATRSLNRYRNMNRHHNPISENCQELPLRWKKISSVGSYANESKHWRPRKNEIELNKNSHNFSHGSASLLRDLSSSASTSCSTGGLNVAVQSSLSIASSNAKSDPSSTKSTTIKTGHTSVARYMQPTKCSITKQRLSPNFAASYGVLDFTHVVRSESRSAKVVTSSLPLNRSRKVPQVSSEKVLQRRAQHTLSFRR